MRFNKSLMAHRVYIFFHCYHGGLICAFAAVLSALVVFILVNPLDIVWSDLFTLLKDKVSIDIQGISNPKLKEFLEFASPHFRFFAKKLSVFEMICLALIFIGIVAGIICAFMRKAAGSLLGFSVSFYSFSVFLLVTLQTVSGNFFEGLVVVWTLIAVIFMMLCHLILGGSIYDAAIRVVLTGFFGVISGVVGIVLAAFPSMLSPVDSLNIYWLAKFSCGGVMLAFALFHFDIMLKIFDVLAECDGVDRVTDPINDMIGNEYIEGISGR